MHSPVDDHSRLAYSDVLDEETAVTTAAFLAPAITLHASRGITIRGVISDNGPSNRSREGACVNTDAGITVLRTCPNRRQTNGKVERYQRTLRDEWG